MSDGVKGCFYTVPSVVSVKSPVTPSHSGNLNVLTVKAGSEIRNGVDCVFRRSVSPVGESMDGNLFQFIE